MPVVFGSLQHVKQPINVKMHICMASGIYINFAFTRQLYHQMSHGIGFPTICYVRPGNPQISLRIRAV